MKSPVSSVGGALGTVTISDFIDLASRFNSSGVTWQEGDLNYDGAVTISDFIDLSANFNTSYSGDSFPISLQEAQILSSFALENGASVPEPAISLTIVLVTLLLPQRRPKRLV